MNSEKLKYKVSKGSIQGPICVPSSKSHANRALILAAITDQDIALTNMPKSTDVETMLKCFKLIGLEVIDREDGVLIRGSFPKCEKNIDTPLYLETGDGGTTNRFLIPLLALGKRKYEIEALGHMKTRPMKTLIEGLLELKVDIRYGEKIWLEVQGPICKDAKSLEVDASISTQFASGLRLALSKTDVTIKPVGLDGSEAYYKMTCELEKLFNSDINLYNIPVDFSSLSYPIALSLFNNGLEILNCTEIDNLQPDSNFLKIIKEIGGDYHFNKGHLTILPIEKSPGIIIDCKDFPDLVPTLAFCFSYLDGQSELINLKSLRVKECDRIDGITEILDTFKIKYSLDENDNLIIFGNKESIFPSFVEYTPPADHRMIMVSYLFMRKNNGGDLYNYEYVNKSFANFFEVIES